MMHEMKHPTLLFRSVKENRNVSIHRTKNKQKKQGHMHLFHQLLTTDIHFYGQNTPLLFLYHILILFTFGMIK